MTDQQTDTEFQFLGDKGSDRDKLLAACVASQCSGGGALEHMKLDVREFKCWGCGVAGFNTMMGVVLFTCGGERVGEDYTCPNEGIPSVGSSTDGDKYD